MSYYRTAYGSATDDLFMKLITSVGAMSILWFFLSRNLIRHKYSEVICYSMMSFAIIISLLLLLIIGIKRYAKAKNNGIFKKFYNLIKFIITKGFPALLILTQLGVLIALMVRHSDYLFETKILPPMFNTFNVSAAIIIIVQIFAWRNKFKNIIEYYKQNMKMNDGEGGVSGMGAKYSQLLYPHNPLFLPGFILAAILSGFAISQLYIILDYLKTDC